MTATPRHASSKENRAKEVAVNVLKSCPWIMNVCLDAKCTPCHFEKPLHSTSYVVMKSTSLW